MSSAVEAVFGGLFTNLRKEEVIHTTLEELGHKQLPTSITTDNYTSSGIANGTTKQQCTNATGMVFH